MHLEKNNNYEMSKKHLIKETIKLLWKYSSRKKWYLLIVLLSSIIATVTSLLFYFYMGKITDTITILPFLKINFIEQIAQISYKDKFNDFILFVSLMSMFVVLQFAFTAIQSRVLVSVSQDLGYYLRSDLFNKLQKLSSSFLDTQSTGNLMSIFTNDIDILVAKFSEMINSLISAFFFTIGGVLFIMLINPILSTIAIGLCIILFSFVLIFIKKSQPFFVKQQNIIGRLSSEVQEYNAAHEMTTLYGYEDSVINKFKEDNQELKVTTRKAQSISGIIFPYNNFINNFIITLITALILIFMCFKPDLLDVSLIKFQNPISIIMLFIMMLRQTTSKISEMLSQLNSLQLTFAAAIRVQGILNVANEDNSLRVNELKVSKADIKFENIVFGYNENKIVLDNVSFEAKPGTVTAIVGPTGSGKTTIISLLSSFYDLNSGKITIDKQDISKCTRSSIRDNIALVLQDSFIFNGTIMENIRYGRLDATDEEVIQAAKLANADKFINHLSNKYNTVISNDYELLSEGEKQLIAIARIFLSKSKILVLDEATSYVDTKTEKDIQDATKKLMKNKTSIVIAHRLSTIKDADNIIVIKDGKLIESGNHQQLMKNKKFYYELNTAMEGDFDLEKD